MTRLMSARPNFINPGVEDLDSLLKLIFRRFLERDTLYEIQARLDCQPVDLADRIEIRLNVDVCPGPRKSIELLLAIRHVSSSNRNDRASMTPTRSRCLDYFSRNSFSKNSWAISGGNAICA